MDTAVALPASKSISNRVLIINALCEGSTYPIENLSESDDTKAMLAAFTAGNSIIDIGAAGTSMRFLTAYLSQKEGEWTITGTARMKNRPIKALVEALRATGACISYLEQEGFPPLRISGRKLSGGKINLSGSISSQYISALLMIAPGMKDGLTVCLEGEIISRSYIRMTIELMRQFGVKVEWEGSTIRIEPQLYRPLPFCVEGDWSAASYWNEIRALGGDNFRVNFLNLHENSLQGDAKQTELFAKLKECSGDKPFVYDFIDEPDLAQTFIVSCCLLDIPFRFGGLQSLRIKETDRIAAMQTEMRKLGYLLETGERSMAWTGERTTPEATPVIATYEDHRMAMAFAPACLKTNRISIENPEVVSKSYPGFWRDLQAAGFTITTE